MYLQIDDMKNPTKSIDLVGVDSGAVSSYCLLFVACTLPSENECAKMYWQDLRSRSHD